MTLYNRLITDKSSRKTIFIFSTFITFNDLYYKENMYCTINAPFEMQTVMRHKLTGLFFYFMQISLLRIKITISPINKTRNSQIESSLLLEARRKTMPYIFYLFSFCGTYAAVIHWAEVPWNEYVALYLQYVKESRKSDTMRCSWKWFGDGLKDRKSMQ